MAMGTTRDDESQDAMWVATADLPRGAGHPFYERLNQILAKADFDAFVESLCAPFYARMRRPSLAPGRYFRLLLVGYFEGLDSERAIAWRAADSLSRGRFCAASISSGAADGAARPLDDLADATAVERGNWKWQGEKDPSVGWSSRRGRTERSDGRPRRGERYCRGTSCVPRDAWLRVAALSR